MNTGRNDPCPCGSGNKRKTCCMNNVISLDLVISKDLDELQQELFASFDKNHPGEVFQLLDEMSDGLTDEEADDEEKLLSTLVLIWIIFHKKFKSKTIAEEFLEEKRQKRHLRSIVLKHLESWTGIIPSFSIITKVIDDEWIEVKDLFSQVSKTVKLDDDDFELEEGMILLGFLIPYLDYEKYFLFFLDFLVEDTKEIKDIVTKAFKYSDFDDVNEFMITEFPTILETLFFDEEALESKKPMLELVPNLLKGND